MVRRNERALVIPIIEALKGLEDVAAIAAVEGIDVLHFGPGDLSADVGLKLATNLPILREASVTVRDACHAAGRPVLVPRTWDCRR